jgi:indolepyruvate ferredoxin oxidoreductase alpha subunit
VALEPLIKAIGVPQVVTIRPYQLKKSIAAIRDAVTFDGVSVVIAEEKCALYAKGLRQLRGKAFRVSDRCRNHRECINALGCPAFTLEDNRVQIDADICIGCALCAQVCPEHAIVPVKSKS